MVDFFDYTATSTYLPVYMILWNGTIWTFTVFFDLLKPFITRQSLSLPSKNCLVYFFDVELSSIFQHMFEISCTQCDKKYNLGKCLSMRVSSSDESEPSWLEP